MARQDIEAKPLAQEKDSMQRVFGAIFERASECPEHRARILGGLGGVSSNAVKYNGMRNSLGLMI
jgi:hypothetical protein